MASKEISTRQWLGVLTQHGDELEGVVENLLSTFGDTYNRALVTELARIIRQAADRGNCNLDAVFSMLSSHDTVVAHALAAHLLLMQGEKPGALEAFQKLHHKLSSPDPDILLDIAKLQREENPAEALSVIKSALSLHPDYAWHVRAELVVDKLIRADAREPERKIKLALLSSSTTALLAPVLRTAGIWRDIQFEIYEGAYGNYRQEILDPSSRLYECAPDIAVILINSRDVNTGPVDKENLAGSFVRNLRELWRSLQDRQPCHIIQIGFEIPSGGSWGSLEDTLPAGRRRQVLKANLALSEDLPEGVSFIDIPSLCRMHSGPWQDNNAWHLAKQYPAGSALPLLADAIVAHCAAVYGLSSKVLALDLDNTCWGGVIGEDGVGGIEIGPPGAAGEAYSELQQYARELAQRGVMLTVCSKNNPSDAEEPFQKHDGMILKQSDFVAFTANWQDKATNLVQQAEDLQLGIDSFVFIDDSSLEREWVRQQTPVTVPESGHTPAEMLQSLQRGMYFEGVQLTKEDVGRSASYKAVAEQKKIERSGGSMEEFLSGLEMKCIHGPLDELTLARVTQLTNKTNQFNLTTKRYTQEQVKTIAESDQWWSRWFRLEDRFGDHGLIGVMFVEKTDKVWEIDTWLMSCRVLGRNMEEVMIHELLTRAQAAGAKKVKGVYLPTPRNNLVSDLYERMGFVESSEQGVCWFDLEEQPFPECRFIAH